MDQAVAAAASESADVAGATDVAAPPSDSLARPDESGAPALSLLASGFVVFESLPEASYVEGDCSPLLKVTTTSGPESSVTLPDDGSAGPLLEERSERSSAAAAA